MTDPRLNKLAKLLIEYSTDLKKGETILLDMIDVPDEMTVALMRAARAVGGVPLVECRHYERRLSARRAGAHFRTASKTN